MLRTKTAARDGSWTIHSVPCPGLSDSTVVVFSQFPGDAACQEGEKMSVAGGQHEISEGHRSILMYPQVCMVIRPLTLPRKSQGL